MPFKKTGRNRYRSPSGRKFTKKQVVAYYASKGFTKRRGKRGKARKGRRRRRRR